MGIRIPVVLLWLLLAAWPWPARAGDAGHPLRVAIIDRFYPPMEGFPDEDDRRSTNWMYGVVDLDRDREKEPYYHGDMVQLIAAHPGFSFFQYPMRRGNPPMDEILQNLREVRARLPRQPVEALVLSWESSSLISAFEKPLRRDHAQQYQARVRQWGETSPVWRATYRIIQELEALVGAGVTVYTIAGNGGRGMVNTFSFARGVVTVGAVEPELADFVASNAFVDVREQAAYEIVRVDDARGQPLGYDVDGDGCADIPLSKLTGSGGAGRELPRKAWQPIKGSSFAAPMALKKALLQRLGPRDCSLTAVTRLAH